MEGATFSLLSAQGPYLASGLQDLPVDLRIINALGFCDRKQFIDVIGPFFIPVVFKP